MKSRSFVLLPLLATIFSMSVRAQTIVGAVEVDGVERTWQLFVPSNYKAGVALPLVLDLHGTGGSPRGQAATSAFTKLAAEKGFLVVNPPGKYVRTPTGSATWNVDLDSNGVDDVRFVRSLIEHLKQRYSIDSQRIYATGFSGGARMSSRIACDLADVVAAVGLVGGVRFPERCAPATPVAILAIHSEDDGVNHYVHRADSPAYWPVGVHEAIVAWARQNQCAATPSERALAAGIVGVEYERCVAGGDVTLVKLDKGGHTWPGSAAAGAAGYAATAEIWKFFERHSRQQ
jgi:polyhydroxybutyrate depolymerase